MNAGHVGIQFTATETRVFELSTRKILLLSEDVSVIDLDKGVVLF
jgi:hypothetical protein